MEMPWLHKAARLKLAQSRSRIGPRDLGRNYRTSITTTVEVEGTHCILFWSRIFIRNDHV
eukprot:scaffold2123_cov96-Cylindrotheca_fusiformis.AAC.9